MRHYFALVLVQMFLFGCSSDGTHAPAEKYGKMTELVPRTAGTQWTYLARSQSERVTDTIRIRYAKTASEGVPRRVVSGGDLLSGRFLLDFIPVDVWVAGYPPSASGGDTLVFYWSPLDSMPAATFVLPPQAHNSWSCDSCNPLRLPARGLTFAVSLESLSLPAGDFDNVLHIRSRYAFIPPPSLNLNLKSADSGWPDFEAEFWIRPGVGLVKQRVTLLWEEKPSLGRDQNQDFDFELQEYSTGVR